MSYDFSLNYGEIWAQSNDSLWVWYSHGCTWKTVEEKWSLFVFSILFCIFSTTCLKNQRQPYVMMFRPLTSLRNLRNLCRKSEWILFCNVLKSFWTCLWAMEKLMASVPFNNLTDFFVTFTIFVFLCSSLPTNQRLYEYEFCTTIYHSQPNLLTRHFLVWQLIDWNMKSSLHLEILASKSS